MKQLLSEIQASVASEYERAAAKFGAANNSHHESYAVILEEYEEAVDEGNMFSSLFADYWNEVKRNGPKRYVSEQLIVLQEVAEHAAAEWVQVAAMCHKAQIERKGERHS